MNSMETAPSQALTEIYGQLDPLDRSREVYLTCLMTKLDWEAGRPLWDPTFEQTKRDYSRQAGQAVNAEIARSGATTSEEIEDIMVQQISSETQRRWLVYSLMIQADDKEDVFEELVREADAITLDLVARAEQRRTAWQQFVRKFGADDGEFNPDLRAEFIRNKLTWDLAKEGLLLRDIWGPSEERLAS